MPIGDLRAIAGIDDVEWVKGVLRIQNANKGLASSMNNDLGRGISQVGFAIQDFTSVLAMGGANSLGRAMMATMNNVQMLGTSFGPWGLAITSVAGSLGSILIPRLMDADSKTEELTDATKKHIAEYEKLAKEAGDRAKFDFRLGGLTISSAPGEIRSREEELAGLRAERDVLEREAQGMLLSARSLDQVRLLPGDDPLKNLPATLKHLRPGYLESASEFGVSTDSMLSFPAGGGMVPGAEEAVKGLKEFGKRLEELDKKIGRTTEEIEDIREAPKSEKYKKGSLDNRAMELGTPEAWRTLNETILRSAGEGDEETANAVTRVESVNRLMLTELQGINRNSKPMPVEGIEA